MKSGGGILERVDSRTYDSLADKLEALSGTFRNSDIPSKEEAITIITQEYLSSEEKRNYGIHACGKLGLKEFAPKLMQFLGDSLPERDIEATILALGDLEHEPAYSALETYVRTEQNHQALIALSNIDFEKTAKYLNEQIDANVKNRYNPKEEDGAKNKLLLTTECIFTDMLDKYGVETTLENLTYLKTQNPEKRKFILDALKNSIKVSEQEIGSLLEKAEKVLD